MKKAKEVMHENRVKLVEQIRVSMEQQSQRITDNIDVITKLSTTSAEHTNTLNDQDSKLRLSADKTGILLRDVTAMYRDLGNLENSKMDRQQCTNMVHDLKKTTDMLYTEISLKENHIVTIENFIEKYLPVRILS
jgi:hypothetical protein